MIIFKNRIEKDFFWSCIFILFLYFVINNPITHPIPKLETGEWAIEQIQKPIFFGTAGHNFLILRDEKGNIVSELHGLATNTTTGQTEFVTYNNTGKLKVWEFTKPKYNLSENKFAGNIIADGNKEEMNLLWGKARDCANKINEENISYPSFGFKLRGITENSNSVAYTLSLCMGLDIKHLGIISPGEKLNLLNK